MAVIGIDLEGDQLVLTRGRDFKWTFTNLDDQRPPQPVDFPAGELFFELDTGGEHNALQEVTVDSASDGTYKLGFKGQQTANIDYYDVVENPHGIDGDITDALEALPNIGPGNVEVHPASLVPVWELSLTLNAAHNEVQNITFLGNPTGGNFKIGLGLEATGVIAYQADGSNAGAVKTALEALTGVGAGNVAVGALSGGGYRIEFIGAKAGINMPQMFGYAGGIDFTQPNWFFGLTGGFFPSIQVTTVVDGIAQFNEKLVNVLNKTINDFFNSFEGMAGVDIDFVVNSNINAVLKVTSLKSFVESDIITFGVDITANAIEGVLNNVASLFGLFQTLHVDFYWKHVYRVEFVNELGLLPQPALEPDITNLIGLNGKQSVTVDVIEPGKERFTKWPFVIAGSSASIKIESEVADDIVNRTDWQLVFLPDGEPAGGDPIALGKVRDQGTRR